MREATRERLQRVVGLSESLGEELLAAGFSETDPRFSRSLLNAGSHAIKASECYGRITQGRPARQVRVLRADGTEVESPRVEAPPLEFVRMERVQAVLAAVGVEALPIEVMAETETEQPHEQLGT